MASKRSGKKGRRKWCVKDALACETTPVRWGRGGSVHTQGKWGCTTEAFVVEGLFPRYCYAITPVGLSPIPAQCSSLDLFGLGSRWFRLPVVAGATDLPRFAHPPAPKASLLAPGLTLLIGDLPHRAVSLGALRGHKARQADSVDRQAPSLWRPRRGCPLDTTPGSGRSRAPSPVVGRAKLRR